LPIEKLINKIKKEAEEKASKILQDAEEEKNKILEDAEKEKVKIITYAKREAQEEKKIRIDAIKEEERIRGRMMITAKKREIIETVFKRASVLLKNEDAKEYRRHAEKLFELAVEDGDEEVVLDKEEKRIDASFIESLNNSHHWKLKLAKDREDMGGGFKLKKGRKIVDFSYPVLFSTLSEDLLPEISKILFEK